MSDTVIQVDNVSKYYRLGVIGTGTLSHDLNRWWAKIRGRPDPTLRVDQMQKIAGGTYEGQKDYIWALKDVSFEVKQGEVLGIIGRNGAGKSTLLKILSRVTAPTTGECRVRGRIASLLEVGTGFHPELTGRENIFLNGAILGMTKDETRRKFDEIVAFSEVEKYIDTPVKRYSSGMYVRLAFAVAAHLEPEILIVDEVLAVGDADFQKKCLGKMDNVSREGRTVLFVSHNMATIQSLCPRTLLFNSGSLEHDDLTEKIINLYRERSDSLTRTPIQDRLDRKGSGPLRFTGISFESLDNKEIYEWPCGAGGYVIIHYESNSASDMNNVELGFSVSSSSGQPLFQCFTRLTPEWQRKIPPRGSIRCYVKELNIKPGVYLLNMYAEVGNQISDWIQEATQLAICGNDFFGSGKLPDHPSFMLVHQQWTIDRNQN